MPLPEPKDWADRRADSLIDELRGEKDREKARMRLADMFRDLANACEPRHPLDL